MKVSLNWLSDYIKLKKTPEQIVERLTMSSIEVESIAREEDSFKQIVVGYILQCEKHPLADRLKTCRVNVGDRELNIVCGAANVAAGQKVAVALPGAVVTDHKIGEKIEIKSTVLRGVESQGMICSEDELGLPGPSAGIMVLPDDTPIGAVVATVIGKKDVILDLAILAHRGDCMGHVGVARELSALFDLSLQRKKYTLPKPTNKKKLNVKVADGNLCPRYSGLIISGIDAKIKSPLWLQQRLQKVGERPISFVVDLTNYIMHDLGQPLHAFDFDQLHGQEITVRVSTLGESIKVLGDEKYVLPAGSIIIEDKDRLVDLAGIKGGAVSGFSEKTTTLFLEAAAMNGVTIRRTSRRIGLRTEAVAYFEKGVDEHVLMEVLAQAFDLLSKYMPGVKLEGVVDVRKKLSPLRTIVFHPDRVARLGGIEVDAITIKTALQRLGFIIVKKDSQSWKVEVPSWRKDVTMEEDLVEEVIRIVGYKSIPARLPQASIGISAIDPNLIWQRRIKQLLADQGGFEVVNFSFLSPDTLRRIGLKQEDHVRVQNPLSEDQGFMRSELVSGILLNLRTNIQRTDNKMFFELGRVFFPGSTQPKERTLLTICATGDDAFSRVKGFAQNIFDAMSIECVSAENIDKPKVDEVCAYWQMFTEGSATVLRDNSEIYGVLGRVSAEVLQNFDQQKQVAFCTLYIDTLVRNKGGLKMFKNFSRFPSIFADVSMFIDDDISWQEIDDVIKPLLDNSPLNQCQFLDVFTGKNVPEGKKSISFRLHFQAPDRTLTMAEVDTILALVWQRLEVKFAAQIRK